MKTYKDISEKEFYKKYGDYEIKFYSYFKNEFIFGIDEEDKGNIDLIVRIEDISDIGTKLNIYSSKKYKVSNLRDFIWSVSIFSKEKQQIIEEYNKE